MTMTSTKRVNDALIQFMIKLIEAINQLRENVPRFFILNQTLEKGMAYGLDVPF